MIEDLPKMDLLKACCSESEWWDLLLSAIGHSIVVADLEGRILFASPAVEEMLGFSPSQLEGRNFSCLLTDEDLECLYPNILYIGRKGEPFEGDVMLVRKDGSRFIAFITACTRTDPDLRTPVRLMVVRDVDSQRRFERTFSSRHYSDLIKIADGIAHEIRNPLVGIGGFINRLSKICSVVHDHQDYYGHIMNNLRRIESLIKKVEFFARLPRPSFEWISVKELVERAAEPYRQEFTGRCIEFSNNAKETSLSVDGDLIQRVFSILIENSLDAMPGGGRIAFETEMANTHCLISVTDNGKGISTEDLPYVFNPFFSTKPDGAGIDLAVVKRIVEGHGGEVQVRSAPGEGASFALRIPVDRRRRIRTIRLEDATNGGAGSSESRRT